MLANYQQTKVIGPPNLSEPIGFDQLPDGRIIQTARRGGVRLHDPRRHGTLDAIRSPTIPVYTNSEDGLYGPAIDNNFATNHWVYLYYAPPTVDGHQAVRRHDVHARRRRPTTGAEHGRRPSSAWDPWSATSSSRASSSSTTRRATRRTWTSASEQKILRVSNNRGACCHVAGDIDFDKHNNLWLVTGDDTPAGGGNAGGFGPRNDMKTDETQTVRVNNATGGTFTLTFDGQTTAPLAVQRDAPRRSQAALEALSATSAPATSRSTGGPVNTANVDRALRRRVRRRQNVAAADGRRDRADRHRRRPSRSRRRSEGGWFQRAVRRRPPLAR